MYKLKKSGIFIFLLFLLANIFFTIETKAQENIIQSASELNYPPFAIVNDEGKADGFSVDLLRATLKAVNLEVSFYTGPWSEIKEDLKTGKIEVLPLVGRTPEREAFYDFTVPYTSIYGNIFIRTDDNSIKNLLDLKNKEILVMAGDNAEEFARRENISNNIYTTESYEEAFKLLSEGKHDAIITQNIVGSQIIKNLKLTNIVSIYQIDQFRQDFTFAVKKGNKNLLSQLNEGLSKIIANNTFDEIHNKWFEEIKDTKKSEGYEELLIKLKALQVANQINTYLEKYPNLTIKELQENPDFKKLAVQLVGETGYTGIIDSQDGTFYFHPQEILVNTDSQLLKNNLPSFWSIFSNTIGDECRESSGYYNWKESDGTITEKFLSTACVKHPTADGKYLFVSAATYSNELVAIKYLEKYKITDNFSYAKGLIDQRAIDIAKQLELYMSANTEKTLEDFKQDTDFQKLAVQSVGETGYTYLITHETGVLNFHPDPKIKNTSYDSFKEKFSAIWDIIDRSVKSNPCQDSSGFYMWEDIDGNIRDKYTYHHCLEARTADGYTFFLGASTYLDEYNSSIANTDAENTILQENLSETNNTLFINYIYGLIAGLLSVFIVLFLLYNFNIIKLERTTLLLIMVFIFISVSGVFVFGSYSTVKKLKINFKNTYANQHLQLENILSEQIAEIIEDMKIELEYLSKIPQDEIDNYDYFSKSLKGAYEKNKTHVYASYLINKDNVIKEMHPLDPAAINTDLSEQAHMKKVQKTLAPVLSDVFDAVEGFKGVTLHYPIIKNGEYNGTVAFLINIDNFINTIAPFSKHIHPHESFLLDSMGRIIISDDKNLSGKNILTLEKYQPVKETFNKIIKAEKEGTEEYELNNKKIISVFVPIKMQDNRWTMVITGDEKNTYQGIDGTLNNIWFFTLLTLISFVVFSSFFSYFITKSLRTEVEIKTTEIKNNSDLIKKQLKKEESITKEKEKLLEEQKKAQNELEKKIDELKKFQKLTIDREIKMIELKKKITLLESKK